jgi:hypothetical protein
MDEQIYRFWKLERNAARGFTPSVIDDADFGNLSPIQRFVQLHTTQADLVGERHWFGFGRALDALQCGFQLCWTVLFETYLVSHPVGIRARLMAGMVWL